MAEDSSTTPLVLVTGASGFIAIHVVNELLQRGYRVRGTVRSLQNTVKVEPLQKLCPDAKYPLKLVEADLLSADTWPPAVKDCDYVMHVASPLPMQNPRQEDEVIGPAVDGTLNVLRACQASGTVKRVILTSSYLAVTGGDESRSEPFTEADWTNADKVERFYTKSKVLAEKAAWAFHKDLPETERFELAVVNPGFVLGPMLCGVPGVSFELVKALMEREIPVLPRTNLPVVDVRDVVASHLAAMTVPDAAGHRHIVAAKNLWHSDLANIIKEEFSSQGYNVPTTVAPYALFWMIGWFDNTVRLLLPQIGVVSKLDTNRMTSVLGIRPKDMRQTILDTCYSMIERGYVKKTAKYTGPRKN